MEFFCYHRDRAGSLPLRDELAEEHWSYMDQYAKEMIARGPTLADDGGTPPGSVHVVTLPAPAAARAFAFDEPNYQAGVYRDVLLRRWHNVLGRTMWDFPGGRTGGHRYLVLGLGTGHSADRDLPPDRDDLIAYGPLLSDDGALWLGTAALSPEYFSPAPRGRGSTRAYEADPPPCDARHQTPWADPRRSTGRPVYDGPPLNEARAPARSPPTAR